MKFNQKKLFDLQFAADEIVVGLDEVGKGAGAGPLLIAAVGFSYEKFSKHINDSKKLTAIQRQKAYKWIIKNASFIELLWISAYELDHNNIDTLLKAKYTKFISQINIKRNVRYFVVDFFKVNVDSCKIKSIAKADCKSFATAAASIVAKVTRDELMKIYGKVYPEYLFESNSGYLTIPHIKKITKHKTTEIHRKKFIKDWKI